MTFRLVAALFAVSAGAGLLSGNQAPQSAAPDLALVDGRVYTLDSSRPWAEAVAVRGDRIVGVGSSAEIRQTAGPSTRVIDLKGAFVSPGFNDAHVHVESTGALLTGANLLDVHEPKAFRERMAQAASRLPAGSWITRGDWGAYEQWGQGSTGAPGGAGAAGGTGAARGPFMPDRQLIDDVTPNHPVLVNRFDQSAFLANSLALKLAGIADATPNPAGGEFVRDANGRMTGVLRGSAVQIVRKAVTPISFEQRLAQVRAVLQEAREGGVTTIQDLTTGPQLRAYQHLHARGELTARILLRPTLDMVAHIEPLGITRGFGDHWLKYIGYKAWVDGIMGGSTAMFFEPYSNNPANKGTLRPIMRPEGRDGVADEMTPVQKYTDAPPGNLEKLLVQAARSGLTPHVHAIGDKAVRILLDVYDRVLTQEKLLGTDHRWRVIHAQVLYPGDAARFGRLGLVAEVNPYHISDDMRWMEERIGTERSRGAYAFRTLKNAGAVLVFGSDSPGTNAARYFLNPVYGLYAATSRQTLTGEPRGGWFPGERLTIDEAIEAATKNPAWASFEENVKGTIGAGQLADLAVFDTNLVEAGRAEPARLLKARVLYTIAGGKVVYTR
jgi:predicted amidohydrolase YtcJ